MIAIVQRVVSAKVTVENEIVGQIGQGMLVLAAVEVRDRDEDVTWVASKLTTLRIFKNGDKYFDQDVQQIAGSILLVSNFTVAAETASGRRPSLSNAAPPDRGRELFHRLVEAVRQLGVPLQTGRFGAEMQVELVNDGPVTFLVKSPLKDA